MVKTYQITVYNTLTSKYEDVTVSEEVYHAYSASSLDIRRYDGWHL